MCNLDEAMTILEGQTVTEALTTLEILQGVLGSLVPQDNSIDIRLRSELFGFIVGYRAALVRPGAR